MSRLTPPARNPRIAAILPLFLLVVACGGNGADPEIDEPFVGNWVASSFLIAGVEHVTPAGDFNVSIGLFEDGSYQLIVNGDPTGLLCDLVPSCVESGDFSHSGSVLTLDPGTADELRLQYSVSGNELSVAGVLDGTPISATFDRI